MHLLYIFINLVLSVAYNISDNEFLKEVKRSFISLPQLLNQISILPNKGRISENDISSSTP